jgi:hypothetical protein
LEEIKEKIKTFMIGTTYTNGFEEWTKRVDTHRLQIHRIKVFKYIIEVNEEEPEERESENPESENPETNPNPIFKVSIYTDTVTIRYGGSLWNQFEACFDELSSYLFNGYYDNEEEDQEE